MLRRLEQALPELACGKDDSEAGVTVGRERRRKHGLALVVGRDSLHDELPVATRLQANSLRGETIADRLREQARVDERRLSRSRLPIQQDSAIDDHLAEELFCVPLAREEDQLVAERYASMPRNGCAGTAVSVSEIGHRLLEHELVELRHERQTSSTMNCTHRFWFSYTSRMSGSGSKSTEKLLTIPALSPVHRIVLKSRRRL